MRFIGENINPSVAEVMAPPEDASPSADVFWKSPGTLVGKTSNTPEVVCLVEWGISKVYPGKWWLTKGFGYLFHDNLTFFKHEMSPRWFFPTNPLILGPSFSGVEFPWVGMKNHIKSKFYW
jgi:hypothetical protein